MEGKGQTSAYIRSVRQASGLLGAGCQGCCFSTGHHSQNHWPRSDKDVGGSIQNLQGQSLKYSKESFRFTATSQREETGWLSLSGELELPGTVLRWQAPIFLSPILWSSVLHCEIEDGQDQESANYGPLAKFSPSPVFVKFYWNTAMPFCLVLSVAAFLLQWQNWVVAKET